MAGLLTPPQDDAAAGGAQQAAPQGASAQNLSDPILQQVEQGIEEKVPPDLKKDYDSIVLAGMDVMFNPKTSDLIEQQLDAQGDIVDNVADGISKLMMIIYNESQGRMSIPAAGLACVTLMCQALDYWEKTRDGQVTDDLVAQATKATVMKTLQRFGISQQQVDQTVAAGQAQGGGQPEATEA
ncbi:MAG TPA: hypothetical protein VN663_14385 [Ramlibacter sp.]|nr:hypothetical protein [Ramlibacter sp.]